MTPSLLKQFDNIKAAIPEHTFFVTATDTDAGKTVFTWQFAQYLRDQGESVVILKPVECGEPGKKDSDFYRTYLGEGSCVCPYSFDRPVSPHYEAERTGTTISLLPIAKEYGRLCRLYDWVIIEGAGGLYCPLDDGYFMIDLIEQMNLPTLLVVPNKVGCLNHTLLSVEAIRPTDINLVGLVLNGEQPVNVVGDIEKLAKTPLLAVLPKIEL